MNIFSVKGFLKISGAILLLFGILGFAGIIGPTPAQSIFGSSWWFDTRENIADSVVGVASLMIAFIFPPVWQRYIVILIGIVAILVGLYNFVSPTLLGATFQTPEDLVFHLIIGAWALYTVFGNTKKS